jgi:NADPH-dependent ferric siderophore reductase
VTVRNFVLDRIFWPGEVQRNEPFAGRLRLITIVGERLRGLDWQPGQHVRVHVGESAPGLLPGPLRTYSIWDRRADAIDLCVLDHGDGPGARWARSARPGQEVLCTKPQGNLVVQPGPYHVFVGDETASVAFGPMLRSLPTGADVHGVIEVDSPDDRLPLPEGVTWRYREGASAASSTALVEAVAKLTLPAEPGIAYVAGELRTLQAVRAHFTRDRRWPRRSVVIKPFWTPGRTGMD